jgi:hypothetical protein
MKQNYISMTIGLALLFASAGVAQTDNNRQPSSAAHISQSAATPGDDGKFHASQPSAQGGGCDSLKTTFAMGNSNAGAMFDVRANLELTVTFIDAILYGTTGTVYIYTRPGTHVGHENSSAGWTLADSAQITLTTSDSLYRLPIFVDYHMNAGDTAAFYVTTDGANISMDYTDGIAVGNLLSQDIYLKAFEGTGKSYPFANSFTPRNFNGVINYCPTGFPPCQTTATTYAGGNGLDGNMFDLSSDYDITINAFYGNINGTGNMRIFYHTGTYVGTETNSAAWTLLDSAIVVSTGTGAPTFIPITVNLPVAAGQTMAFYITGDGVTTAVDYTNGTSAGNVYTFDGVISIHEGAGVGYPFTTNTAPRVWNGSVDYCLGITGTEELETAAASMSVYPNPASENATLASKQPFNNATVIICDVTGRVVETIANVNGSSVRVNTAALSGGVYFFSVSEGGQLTGNGKFIVQ